MNALTRADFAGFFAAMHDGHRPYRWQERLLDTVLAENRWPDSITAPTGAGKTAVIDVHVFAQALTADLPARPPRRLALVVNRRVLVDDQYVYARALARRLADPSGGGDPVFAEIHARLRQLRHPTDPTAPLAVGDSPLVVGRLRGGAPPSRAWRDHPTAASIVCATPDMWGSRLLFRGYGSAGRARSREAGLLAIDSAVVVDEAHLAQQLLHTARRVSELVPVADHAIDVAPLQVVATTATPPSKEAARSVVGVEPIDLVDDRDLTARLCRPKPVRLIATTDWGKPTGPAVTTVADAVVDLTASVSRTDGATRTVGCFLNTVPRAIAVAQELRKRALRVVLVCGQVRPVDIDRLEQHHPGLLSPSGNDGVDVLVSTQSLEVGVDLDLAGLVSDLASGSALAQRAGRINRRGLRPTGPVVIVAPQGIDPTLRSGPYDAAELGAAATWLERRIADDDGLAPWTVRNHPPQPTRPRRTLLQRPELADAWHWARTSDDLAAEPELDLWLSDDFEADLSVGIVVRDNLPEDAVALLQALPPRRHEVFSVPIGRARAVLARIPDDLPKPIVLVRADNVELLRDRGREAGAGLRPGDIVVVDSTAPVFTRSDATFSPPVPAPDDVSTRELASADDVLEAVEPRPGEVVTRIDLPGDDSGADLHDEDGNALAGRVLRKAVQERLRTMPASPMRAAAIALLSARVRDSEVILQPDTGDPVEWILVIDRRRATADDTIRQVITPADRPVTLADHQDHVSDRARRLAASLGLGVPIEDALAAAGAHHDDGKTDPRFQRRLGASDGEMLAKSPADLGIEQIRANERAAGLPTGWRHEQLSVVAAWKQVANLDDPQLIARLIGTSHGYGRSTFPHNADELGAYDDDIAIWLFDIGGWDELIEHTERRYGPWTCAYLEAVLRAADGQISAEGK